MPEDKLDIAKKIKEAREYLGLTQQQVANAISIPRSAVSDIESGKRKVTVDELKQLAILLRHPVSHFLGQEPEMAPEVLTLARTATNLSENDRKELLRFAKYLEYQTKSDSNDEGA